MSRQAFARRAVVGLTIAIAMAAGAHPTLLAQAPAAAAAPAAVWHYFGAAIGLGMIVIGAGLGIGRFAAAAAEGVARQPAAAESIREAISLPLFLLEGVAILAEVFVLLIVLMK